MRRLLTWMLVGLAVLVEMGVPGRIAVGWWGKLCFRTSQKIFALAWRVEPPAR